jgi:hypothetical protein
LPPFSGSILQQLNAIFGGGSREAGARWRRELSSAPAAGSGLSARARIEGSAQGRCLSRGRLEGSSRPGAAVTAVPVSGHELGFRVRASCPTPGEARCPGGGGWAPAEVCAICQGSSLPPHTVSGSAIPAPTPRLPQSLSRLSGSGVQIRQGLSVQLETLGGCGPPGPGCSKTLPPLPTPRYPRAVGGSATTILASPANPGGKAQTATSLRAATQAGPCRRVGFRSSPGPGALSTGRPLRVASGRAPRDRAEAPQSRG